MLFNQPLWDVFEERYELYESEDGAYNLEVQVPGAKTDDVSIDLADGKLSIDVKPSGGHRKKAFSKVFRVGSEFDAEAISAKVVDGILTINLPLVKSKAGKKIKVLAA
jgi:HSP20 family molecular chaperone IbpA